jgi:hypothetical protein
VFYLYTFITHNNTLYMFKIKYIIETFVERLHLLTSIQEVRYISRGALW